MKLYVLRTHYIIFNPLRKRMRQMKPDMTSRLLYSAATGQRGREDMLSIIFGELSADNYIYDPDTFFNHQYDATWFLNEDVRQMIRDVDHSEYIGGLAIDSPFLGSIPLERLSGGVKTLILIANDSDHIFNASACGDNCAQWLLKLGEKKDITIRLGYLMNFGNDQLEIYVKNTGKTVKSDAELVDEVVANNLLRSEN